jgi:RHS repeat-associated protein
MIKYEHLASDIIPIDVTAIYKYDIYGRRIQKDVNGNVTNFMWEGDNLSFELNASYQPIRKYFADAGIPEGDSITSCLAEPRQSDAIDDYWGHIEYSEVTNWQRLFEDTYPQGWYSYIKDQVGTIYKVWDQNAKQIVDNRTYDSFGNLINQTGTIKTPLGFQGKYYDQESGLNYFYHRYYSPSIGRFTSEDPIQFEGGLNFHTFSSSNPINFIDPFGKQITPPGSYNKLRMIYESLFGKEQQIFESIVAKTELTDCQLCLSKCATEKLIQFCKDTIIEEIFLSIVESIFPESWYLAAKDILDISTKITIGIWAEECREKCKKVCCDKNK